MLRKIQTLILTFLVILGMPWNRCFAVDSCSLEKPPLDAAVSGNHGSYFFVYPRHVSSGYTGCQAMWDELGRKIFEFRFLRGELQEYSLVDFSANGARIVCRYDRGYISTRSSKDCSQYPDVMNGLRNVEKVDEPPVPKERDARLR
jgi:hypothetical protein